MGIRTVEDSDEHPQMRNHERNPDGKCSICGRFLRKDDYRYCSEECLAKVIQRFWAKRGVLAVVELVQDHLLGHRWARLSWGLTTTAAQV